MKNEMIFLDRYLVRRNKIKKVHNFIDLTGQRFGRLLVIKREENGKRRQTRWLCKCDCGNIKIIIGDNLKSGHTRSCGCLLSETSAKRMTKHKHSHTRTYLAWTNMKQRCYNPNKPDYHYYNNKKITVCKRWLKFENFFKDVGEIPRGLTLDRTNNNEGYNPKNWRLVTQKQQNRNKENNLFFEYNNKTQLLVDLAKEYGINYNTLHSRIFKLKWSIEKALTTPVRKSRK